MKYGQTRKIIKRKKDEASLYVQMDFIYSHLETNRRLRMKKRVKMMIMIMKVAFFLLFMGKDIATKKEENLEKTEKKVISVHDSL